GGGGEVARGAGGGEGRGVGNRGGLAPRGAHAKLGGGGRRGVALGGFHDELVIHVAGGRPLHGQRQIEPGEALVVAARRAPPRLGPRGQVRQFHAQERGLQLVETARVAELDVHVLAGRAVIAPEPHALRH